MNKRILIVFLALFISLPGFAASKASPKKVTTKERKQAKAAGDSRVKVVKKKTGRVDAPPLVMLKKTTSQMLGELKKHIGRLKNNNKLVYNLVDRVLVPHFDLIDMSRTVVGRSHWKKATGTTQKEFIKEFTRYVINTYSAALQSYDGETMKFYPIRGYRAGTKKVRVSSDLLLKNGPPVQLQYGLEDHNGKWLIYDFSVDGVSIVKNYQSQFASTLRQSGLAGLVIQLKRRNRRG